MVFQSSRDLLLAHVRDVRELVAPRAKADRANARLLETRLHAHAKRHRTLSRLRIAAFALLYASFVSATIGNVPFIGPVAQSAAAVTGLLGVGLLTILVAYLTWRINQLWNRMLIIYGHLIAIYEKGNTRTFGQADLPIEKA